MWSRSEGLVSHACRYSERNGLRKWRPIMKVLSQSAAVRGKLTHPVIDGDGHYCEVLPFFDDYFREVAGPKLFERYKASMPAALQNYDGPVERVGGPKGWAGLSWSERRDRRVTRGGYW